MSDFKFKEFLRESIETGGECIFDEGIDEGIFDRAKKAVSDMEQRGKEISGEERVKQLEAAE